MIFNTGLFTLWFAVWVLLSWPPDPKDIITGALVSVFVTLMTIDVMGRKEKARTPLMRKIGRLGWFFYYALIFLWECLKANIDVAYRVLHPELPIRPGTVRIKVALKSDIGLTFLANSITLTPGTTSVDIDKDRGLLYVHILNIKDENVIKEGKLKVVDKFENILKRIFE